MDEHAQAAGSPAPSPARPTRGGFRGGRGGYGRGAAKKTLGRKSVGKRGGNRRGRGRNKTYDHPRTQAVYERSKELKEIYSDVAAAMKPALEKLADHSINLLLEHPDAHTRVPEYAFIRDELDDRLGERIRSLESEEAEYHRIANTQFSLDREITETQYTVSIPELSITPRPPGRPPLLP